MAKNTNKKSAVKEKFAELEFPIHVFGRHVDITDAMKAYAVDKLLRTERFGGRFIEATVTMDIQKLVHMVDYVLNVNNTKIKVVGRTHDMYSAIDQAISHLEAKLRRYHKRLALHHAKGVAAIDMNVNVIETIDELDEINDMIEEKNLARIEEELKPHPIVKQETLPLKVLTQNEAMMKMELSEDLFRVYRSEEDQKLKVIYRRDDGNYGIIDVE